MPDRLCSLPSDVFILIATSLSIGDLQRLACVSSPLSSIASQSASPILLSRNTSLHVAFVEACRSGHLEAVKTLAMRMVQNPASSGQAIHCDGGREDESELSCVDTRTESSHMLTMQRNMETSYVQVSDLIQVPAAASSQEEYEVLSNLLLGLVAASECGSGLVCEAVLSMAGDRVRQKMQMGGVIHPTSKLQRKAIASDNKRQKLETTSSCWSEVLGKALLPSITEVSIDIDKILSIYHLQHVINLFPQALCMAAHLGRDMACSVICDWLLEEMAPHIFTYISDCTIGRSKWQESVLRCFGMAMLFAFRSAKEDCCKVFTLHPLYRVYLASDVEEKKHYWQQVDT